MMMARMHITVNGYNNEDDDVKYADDDDDVQSVDKF